MNSDELMYLWLCKFNNRNVTASKQSKLCFSTIHTSCKPTTDLLGNSNFVKKAKVSNIAS